MTKKIEVRQAGSKDCGPCCLLSIIRYYGGDISLDELTFLLRTDRYGTNAYNIIETSRYIGFDGYAVKYTFEELIESENCPCIVHMKKNNMYHFIVIYKILKNKKRLLIMDPSEGLKKIRYDTFKEMFLGTVIILTPVKKIYSVKNAYFKEQILNTLIKNKNKLILISFFSFVSVLLSFLPSLVFRSVIDNQFFSFKLIIIFLLSIIFKYIIDKFRINNLIKVNFDFSKSLNNQFFRHLFSLPYLFFKNKSTAEVINRANDINDFENIISDIILTISSDLIFILFSISFLSLINLKLFLIVLLFVFLIIIISLIYYYSLKSNIENLQYSSDIYNKSISESIQSYECNRNINVINLFNKKNEFKYIAFLNNQKKVKKSLFNEYLMKDFLISLCSFFVIFIGMSLVHKKIISMGDLVLFSSLIIYFIDPVKNLLSFLPNLNYSKEIYNRINNLLLMKKKEIYESDEMIEGDIEINNLSFSYNNKINIINKLNFKINFGAHLIIYSPSGHGKSTLFKIILKYLQDYEGNILIDNINLKDIDINKISSSFTYVSQHNYLINDTLENNIKYFRNISDDDYEKVIKICNIDSIRNKTNLRNNLMIEENGFNISGGERQKILLARALLKKSNYLILDEALSEVGTFEELEIIKNIKKYFLNKTIIYVSHKEEIINSFKEKFQLKGGEI